VDSLASIVASCSWGKRVAVGTGAKFDILWDNKEVIYCIFASLYSKFHIGGFPGCLASTTLY